MKKVNSFNYIDLKISSNGFIEELSILYDNETVNNINLQDKVITLLKFSIPNSLKS